MALHSADFSIAGVNTAGTVLLNLKASSTVPITLVEFGVYYAVLSTTAYDVGLVRMNAVGTGTITSTAGAPHVTGATSTAVLETAWVTTRPTVTDQGFGVLSCPLLSVLGIHGRSLLARDHWLLSPGEFVSMELEHPERRQEPWPAT